jgi:type IV fimbrial biogenesis protein FimT
MYKNKGFTLIELMVVIAVMAIIAMMAAPSFGNMLNRKKLEANTNELMLVLNQARSQAVLLRTNIVVQLNGTTTATPTNFFWIPNSPDIKLQGIPQGYSALPEIIFSSQGTMLPRSFIKMKQVTNGSGEKEWVADQVLINGALKDQIQDYPRTITICSEKLKTAKIITYSVVGSLESVQEGSC